jgi:hypothetical protein
MVSDADPLCDSSSLADNNLVKRHDHGVTVDEHSIFDFDSSLAVKHYALFEVHPARNLNSSRANGSN